jgi:GTP-binding protein
MKKDLPIVAIIGRPNVGKSSLFNAFIGERRSIVSEIAGTTRDSLMEQINDLGKIPFWVVDTAGLSDFGDNNLENEIQIQAQVAMENADLILWVVDGRNELTEDDYIIADKLRRSKTPILFIANKIDDGDPSKAYEFMELGFGMPETISAKNNFGFWDFAERLQKQLVEMGYNAKDYAETEFENNEDRRDEDPDKPIKIAFIGRPNVGKSSLLNQLVGQNRSVVSDVSGTTRDSIDMDLFWDLEKNCIATEVDREANPAQVKPFKLIDTAGVRKPGKIGRQNFEFWSSVRTMRSIERADICAILIDALDGVTHQDLVLAGKIVKAGKGIVLCVNKFDLIKEKSQAKEETDEREIAEIKMWGEDLDKIRKDYMWYLHQKIAFLPWAPVLFFSAKTGKGVKDLLGTVVGIAEQRRKRVTTANLNRYIPEIYYGHVLPSAGTKKGKIKMVQQVDSNPPKFLFFVNNIAAFHFTYKRYVENKIREKYGFFGTPIIIEFRDAMARYRGNKSGNSKTE